MRFAFFTTTRLYSHRWSMPSNSRRNFINASNNEEIHINEEDLVKTSHSRGLKRTLEDMVDTADDSDAQEPQKKRQRGKKAKKLQRPTRDQRTQQVQQSFDFSTSKARVEQYQQSHAETSTLNTRPKRRTAENEPTSAPVEDGLRVDGPIMEFSLLEARSSMLYNNKDSTYAQYLGSYFPPEDLSLTASEEYMEIVMTPPSELTFDDIPYPRKLVVLDLNGSLLCRQRFSSKDRRLWRRPYLSALTQYLAHPFTRNPVMQGASGLTQLPSSTDLDTSNDSPSGRVMAPLDAMIWSSVQPQSILPMIDAAFGREQSSLVGIWTREMMNLSFHNYHAKIETTKNLDRVWWFSHHRYSAKSSLLIDDTSSKARMQPYNLLQIPEYTVDDVKHDLGIGTSLNASENADQTLLAVIGILEEARHQENIPAWIHLHRLKGELLGEEDESIEQLWYEDLKIMEHWIAKGRAALEARDIPIIVGEVDPRKDEGLETLRKPFGFPKVAPKSTWDH